MAYSNKAILVDVNGKPIPQIWDEAGDQFVPYEGNVTLSGRRLPLLARDVTLAALAAGASYVEPTLADYTVVDRPAIMLEVFADTPTRIRFSNGGGTTGNLTLVDAVVPPGAWYGVGPFAPKHRYGQWTVSNPTAMNQSQVTVREITYPVGFTRPINLLALLVWDAAIRDTDLHTSFTDSQYFFAFVRSLLAGGKIPVYLNNGLDQAASATIVVGPVNPAGIELSAALGTKELPAGSRTVITNQDFPGQDVPSELIRISLGCSVAPTTGSVYAAVDNAVGGAN